MINIINKEDCVGCNGCVQVCPKQCIMMSEDEQGFMYPKVNLFKCINCGLCEKVCPVLNQSIPKKPENTYAARNKDLGIQYKSSSGGIFFALAQKIISSGGVVFGARFNENWEVIHDFAETFDKVRLFQTSKYVQSNIRDSYIKTRKFLNEGRKVLFSGTPCQIAGLRLFLRKNYGNKLLTVDIVCHGVPSPGIWREYKTSLLSIEKEGGDLTSQSTPNLNQYVITGINFRDKRLGWEKYGFAVNIAVRQDKDKLDVDSRIHQDQEQELLFEPHDKNLYMQGFLKDLYLRPSCYKCPAKDGKSQSDITLADFWGLQRKYPDLYNEKYYSLILQRSRIGTEVLSEIDILIRKVSYKDALENNPSIIVSSTKPKQYQQFWTDYASNGITCINSIVKKIKPPLKYRIRKVLISIGERIIGPNRLRNIVSRLKN